MTAEALSNEPRRELLESMPVVNTYPYATFFMSRDDSRPFQNVQVHKRGWQRDTKRFYELRERHCSAILQSRDHIAPEREP